ncbi:MAG: carbohydrate-binding family 9-like protein [Candidatus Latescibacteria bacterium]|nr:carbohydrate-binding family 9-like protein [Candidatus Latescibacterota bacterium]
MKTTVIAIIIMAVFSSIVYAEKPEYTVYRTAGEISVDGILDEEDWKAAPSFGDFKFPWWKEGVKEQTDARMLWDDKFLYLSFKCDDRHIWAEYFDHNSATCRDDCAEIFWSPAPVTGKGYYMFEMNCIGNVLSVCNDYKKNILDNKILLPHIAQTIKGSVNNDDDDDTGWILEVAIRYSDYTTLSSDATPKNGDIWKIGLNRCGGKTNEQFSQWSPSQTDRPNFHKPEDFGTIHFSTKRVR